MNDGLYQKASSDDENVYAGNFSFKITGEAGTAYEFDDANRLNSLKNYLADGTLLEKYEYTYDANSNITSVDKRRNGFVPVR